MRRTFQLILTSLRVSPGGQDTRATCCCTTSRTRLSATEGEPEVAETRAGRRLGRVGSEAGLAWRSRDALKSLSWRARVEALEEGATTKRKNLHESNKLKAEERSEFLVHSGRDVRYAKCTHVGGRIGSCQNNS